MQRSRDSCVRRLAQVNSHTLIVFIAPNRLCDYDNLLHQNIRQYAVFFYCLRCQRLPLWHACRRLPTPELDYSLSFLPALLHSVSSCSFCNILKTIGPWCFVLINIGPLPHIGSDHVSQRVQDCDHCLTALWSRAVSWAVVGIVCHIQYHAEMSSGQRVKEKKCSGQWRHENKCSGQWRHGFIWNIYKNR